MCIKLSKTACLIVAVLVLSSCAALDKLTAPSLIGTPATSSLVVVKVDATVHGILGIVTDQQIQGGVLLSTDGSKRFDGSSVTDLIIFSNVPPGEYNLARIQTTWNAGTMVYTNTYNVPPEAVLNFVLTTKLGEPRFLGLVKLQDVRNTKEMKQVFSLEPSKEAELATWRKFVQVYEGSPWVEAVQKRLSELEK